MGPLDDGRSGDLFVTLRRDGEVWVGDRWTRERPDDGPYLSCDDRSWEVRCGVDTWFLPQDRAAAAERLLRDGAVAEVRIDDRGHAAVVGVHAP
ncbi:GDYXXLXY domain-containing protein [Nocardioides zeicaulis]|uniref:GDYXXLXY domain-containing protein n=1 Tax=Nocardioides zeicaulis TaxID=1776857 RepID=A0ABV6E3P2_9ACTN